MSGDKTTRNDHDGRPFAVVGGGILGLVCALRLAATGSDVVVFERSESLWTGAGSSGEGKVHLGAVYALGDDRTRERMARGGLEFAPIIESLLGDPVDWDSMCSEPFLHLVAPGSLVGPGELSRRYEVINSTLDGLDDRTYLGRQIDFVVDPLPVVDPVTDLPAFRTAERSVDPAQLGDLLSNAVTTHPSIEVRTEHRVVRVEPASGAVAYSIGEHPRIEQSEPFEAVINCAWEEQQAIELASGVPGPKVQNYRVKAAVLLDPRPSDRNVTLVQGPFGDVVSHTSYTYASWYPVARRHNGFGLRPSSTAIGAQRFARTSDQLATQQRDALAAMGLLDPQARVIGRKAGFILGDGPADIDSRASALHRRGRSGCRVTGRLVTPLNYKFSTAPLAAIGACETALRPIHA